MAIPTRPTASPAWASLKTLEPQGTAPVASNDAIVPPAAMQESGWPAGQVPVRQYENGQLKIIGEWIAYTNSGAVPCFLSEREALEFFDEQLGADVFSNESMFRVLDFKDYRTKGYAYPANISPAVTANAYAVATDGKYVFVGANTKLIAFKVDDLNTEVWRVTLGSAIGCLECVGLYLVAGLGNGNVATYDKSTGDLVDTEVIHTGSGVSRLSRRGNMFGAQTVGGYVKRVNVNAAGQMTVALGSSWTVTTYKPGIAVTENKVWVALEGTPGVFGVQVWDYDENLVASIVFDAMTASPEPQDMKTDGEIVVVGTDPDDNDFTVHVYTGGATSSAPVKLLWRSDYLSSGHRVFVDDTYVYATDATNLVAFDRLTGAIMWESDNIGPFFSNISGLTGDCHRAFVSGIDTPNASLVEINLGHMNRLYQRIDPAGYRQCPSGSTIVPVR